MILVKRLLVIAMLLTTGCATSQILIGHGATDIVRPGPLTLSVYAYDTTSISLRWTAVGDDSISGRATSYTVRYSTAEITDVNWASATDATGEPTPKNAGKYDSLTVTGLASETVYYFGLKATDHAGNVSALDTISQLTDALPVAPVETWDYIVATNGSDSNPGTFAEPFLTGAHAQSVAVAGDTIRFRAGTYEECIEFTESGSDGSTILYAPYNNEEVHFTGDAANRIAIFGLGWNVDTNTEGTAVSYVKIAKFHFEYQYEQTLADASNFGAIRIGGASTSHITIDSCFFNSVTDSAEGWTKDWKHHAVTLLGATYVTLSNNTVTGSFGGGFKYGIYAGLLSAPSYHVYSGNDIQAWSSCINIGELADYADSTELQKSRIGPNNYFYDTWEEDGVQFESGYVKPAYSGLLSVHNGWYIDRNRIYNQMENAIDWKGQRENCWIDGNKMWTSLGDNSGVWDGLDTDGGAGVIANPINSKYKVTIRFNEVYNHLGGITPYVPAQVYHNTVVNNAMTNAGPRTYAGGFGIQWGQGSTGDIIRYPSVTRGLGINNICVENNTSTTYGGNAFVWANSDTLELDYNLYYDSTGTTVNRTLYTAINEADSKAEWLAALKANPPSTIFGGDSNSIWADPEFTTAPFNATYTEHSFDLDAGSPAVGAARCLTHTINSGSSSTSLAVVNPTAIFGGWSEIALSGDSLLIGSSETPVLVTAVNNDTKVVTITPAQSWSVWDEVWLYRDGRKVDDIGARQQ